MGLLQRKKAANTVKKRANCSYASKTDISAAPVTCHLEPVLKNRPIGVLGGIFDPPHHGHLAIAALARDYFKLQRILLIPSGNPPHKPVPGASAADRLAMLSLAIDHEPGFSILDRETRRAGASYTFDTLQELRSEFPGRPLYFIVGSDNIREITTWYRFRDVLKMVTLCVAHRPGFSMRLPESVSRVVSRILPFPSPEWGISSTLVRSYLAMGYSCSHLVPPQVADYIRKKMLYR